MADFDIQRISDAVVTTIKNNIGTEVTEINALYTDFNISAPPTANYTTIPKKVLPARPFVYVTGTVDIENVEGGGREGWYDIDVVFVHDYPAGGSSELVSWQYVQRVGKAISQALKKHPTLDGTSGVLTTMVDAQRPDDETYSRGGKLRNVVIPIRVLEYEADSYP